MLDERTATNEPEIAEMPDRAPLSVALIAAFGLTMLGISAASAACLYSADTEPAAIVERAPAAPPAPYLNTAGAPAQTVHK